MEPITIDSILKNHKNWRDDTDFDMLTTNHELLRNYMKQMMFSVAPKHPEQFVNLFANEDFGMQLYQRLNSSLLSSNGRIWFEEHSDEDKIKFIMMQHWPILTYASCIVVISFNGGDCFVNVFF